MPYLRIYNQSSVVSPSDVQTLCDALNKTLPSFGLFWNLRTVPYAVPQAGSPTQNDNLDWQLVIQDNTSQTGVLGYHQTRNAGVDAYIFAATILSYPNTAILYNPRTSPWTQLTVSSVLFHEVFEMLANPAVNTWYDDFQGSLYLGEVGDPVEAQSFPVSLPGNVTVASSDYVFPSWFGQFGGPPSYNYLGTLTQSFQLAPGGYATIITKSGGALDVVSSEKAQFHSRPRIKHLSKTKMTPHFSRLHHAEIRGSS